MILKTLYLKIGDLGLPTEYTYSFLKRSRFICNYVEREVLKPLKFDADGFKRISIALCSEPKRKPFVNSSKVLCLDLPFDKRDYEHLSGNELVLYYIARIKDGLNVLSENFVLPEDEISNGLDQFVEGGMKNEWLHKKKTLSPLGLKSFLKCKLTMDRFILTLEIYKGKNLLLENHLLETDPDENAFEYRFKDITVEEDRLIITSKTSAPLRKIPLSELACR